MKSLILSIRPEHALNILNGHKTLELRKSVPKDFKGWVYVYVTKGKKDILYKYKDKYYTHHYLTFTDCVEALNSKVVARFWFDDYDDVSTKYRIDKNQIERVIEQACVSYEDFDNYVSDRENVYGWHIKKLEVFDEPMQLSDFAKPRKSMKQENKYWIHKAPQSYMYAWVKEEEE